MPRSASARTNRPGPQPTSSTGPTQRSITVQSASSAGASQRATSSSSRWPVSVDQGQRPGVVEGLLVRRERTGAHQTDHRDDRTGRRSDAACERWSRARPRRRRPRRRRCRRRSVRRAAAPAARPPAAVRAGAAPVSSRDIGTPLIVGRGQRRIAKADRPVAAVAARGPGRRRSAPGRTRVSCSARSCGVSMPTRIAGPGRRPPRTRRPAARPARRRPARRPSNRSGSQAGGRPSSTSRCSRPATVAAARQRVGDRGRGQVGGLRRGSAAAPAGS